MAARSRRRRAISKAFARFAANFPGLTVQDHLIPLTTWSDYADGLVTQIAGGNVPDIINIAIEGVRLAVKKGLLEPLDNYIAASPKAQALLAKVPQQLKDIFLSNIEVNRYGCPDDIAQACLFFASDESAYVTGQIINVDGGMNSHASTVAQFRAMGSRTW